jgi:hypothetical protein
MDVLLHPRGKGEYKKKTSVTIATSALRFASCLNLLTIFSNYIPMMLTSFSDSAIGQIIRPQRVVITSAVDGNGADPNWTNSFPLSM